AVAVLEMNRPSAAVMTNKVANTRRGAAPPTKLTTASAARSTPPVLCKATEKPHQQAADQRGLSVRHQAAYHQRDYQPEYRQRKRRPPRGRKNVLQFR